MIDRIFRAIRLDAILYREVADDEKYNSEGFIIALLAAVLSSVGILMAGGNAPLSFILQVGNSLLFGWLLWSLVAYWVGTSFFGGRSSVPAMLRTLGYANAPRLLGLLSVIPCFGWVFGLASMILSLIAGVIAIREAMEFDTGKAVVTAVVGLLFFIISSILISILLGGLVAPFRHLLN